MLESNRWSPLNRFCLVGCTQKSDLSSTELQSRKERLLVLSWSTVLQKSADLGDKDRNNPWMVSTKCKKFEAAAWETPDSTDISNTRVKKPNITFFPCISVHSVCLQSQLGLELGFPLFLSRSDHKLHQRLACTKPSSGPRVERD